MRESEIERYFVKRVKEAGGLQRKFVSPGHRGVPDRIVVHAGHVYFVELKATGEKLRPDQRREHVKLAIAGADTWVIQSKEGVDNLVSAMLRRESCL
jgi:hypothetical protein